MFIQLPFNPKLHFAEVPAAVDPVLYAVVRDAETLRIVVPADTKERLHRPPRLIVREEVIRGHADPGPDIPGSGPGHREVLGILMLIGSDAHPDHLGFESQARGVKGV